MPNEAEQQGKHISVWVKVTRASRSFKQEPYGLIVAKDSPDGLFTMLLKVWFELTR